MVVMRCEQIGKRITILLLHRWGKYAVKANDEMAYEFDSPEEAGVYFDEYVAMRKREYENEWKKGRITEL